MDGATRRTSRVRIAQGSLTRVLLVFVAMCAVLSLDAGAAAAATGLVGAQPAPGALLERGPSGLRLQFSAPLESHFVVLELWQDGQIASLPARIDPTDPQAVVAGVGRSASPPGTSWVRWRVVTADGHVFAGAYSVRVGGHASASPAPPGLTFTAGEWVAAAGRFLVLIGLVVALGLVVVRWAVVGPAWQAGGVVGPGRPDDRAVFRGRTRAVLGQGAQAWWAAWWGALAAWLAGAVLIAVGMAWWIGAGTSGFGVLVTQTRVGHAADALGAFGVAAVVIGLALRRHDEAGRANPPVGWGVALGICAAFGVGVLAWAGHASDGTDVVINIGADAAHGIASASWLGGLVGLLILVVGPGQALGDDDRVRLLAAAVVRFSTLAIASVAVLGVTGTYRALAELSSLSQLVDTGYGIVLVIKLGIFGLMLAAGGYSRIILHPRLERAALGLDPGDRGASRALRTSLRVELGMALALMMTVAVLLAMTPAG
jgi:copper transport protein